MADLNLNLKVEAERLSVVGQKLLDTANVIARSSDSTSMLAPQVQTILRIAEGVSSSAARLVGRTGGPERKSEAIWISAASSELLGTASQLLSSAQSKPEIVQQAEAVYSTAMELSTVADRLVGQH